MQKIDLEEVMIRSVSVGYTLSMARRRALTSCGIPVHIFNVAFHKRSTRTGETGAMQYVHPPFVVGFLMIGRTEVPNSNMSGGGGQL